MGNGFIAKLELVRKEKECGGIDTVAAGISTVLHRIGALQWLADVNSTLEPG